MRITWYGHASFRLEAGGLALVTDPFPPEEAGLEPVDEPADAVVMSSAADPAHSCGEGSPGAMRVVNAREAVRGPVEVADGVVVRAVATSEGSDRPDDPRANAVYWFDFDGLTCLHLGDVGTPLTAEQLAPIPAPVDVLFALAGAGLVIALPDLDDVIAAVEPRVILPMHHRTPSLCYDAGPVEDFLARRPDDRVEHVAGSSVDLTRDTLPAERTIYVLQASRDPLAA